RMNEVYWARYAHEDGRWLRQGEFGLGHPEAVEVPEGWRLAGNAFAAYPGRFAAAAACIEALPTAAALLRLAPGLLAAGQAVPADRALPLYIRDKVAQTTEERAALRGVPAARP